MKWWLTLFMVAIIVSYIIVRRRMERRPLINDTSLLRVPPLYQYDDTSHDGRVKTTMGLLRLASGLTYYRHTYTTPTTTTTPTPPTPTAATTAAPPTNSDEVPSSNIESVYVCLHGMSDAHDMWHTLTDTIMTHAVDTNSNGGSGNANGVHVVSLDFYGRGHSSAPTIDDDIMTIYDEQLFVNQTMEVLNQLRLLQPHHRLAIVGFSFGGGVSMALMDSLTRTHPHVISRMVLLNPAGVTINVSDITAVVQRLPVSVVEMALLVAADVAKLLRTVMPMDNNEHMNMKMQTVLSSDMSSTVVHPSAPTSSSFLTRFVYHPRLVSFASYHGRAYAYASTLHHYPFHTLVTSLSTASSRSRVLLQSLMATGTLRVMVLCGTDDQLIPPARVQSAMEQYLPGTMVHMMKGTHALPFEHSAIVNERIITFCR